MEYPNTQDNELEVKQSAPAYDRNRLYTVEEWMTWGVDFRSELHDGHLVVMEAPIIKHQSILGALHVQLHTFLKGKTCRVFVAPIGVRLNKKEHTVFEPDIVVICDQTKIADGKICNGAPDLVVEILSPSTSRIDRLYKYNKYLAAGVREYWIVDPEQCIVQVNVLHNGSYIAHMHKETDTVSVTALDGCMISLPEVFAG